MDVLKLIPLVFMLSGCQLDYYIKSAYNQLAMVHSTIPIDKALKDPSIKDEDKRKLVLAEKAHQFAQNDLHLKTTDNYTSFVKLDRPYVTYVVSASPKWELKHHFWDYPFVGQMPYKGYFNEKDAIAEEEDLKKQDFDTYMRGVSAYSTLGWFKDPVLSSMLNYADSDLVNTIIHETVHATIFIKSSADFNERLAVFLGNRGMELFYLKEEGPDSKTLKMIREENEDDKVFSVFITKEIADLEVWYKAVTVKDETARQKRIDQIQNDFKSQVEPKLKSKIYSRFPTLHLNNARLLLYKTYMQDLSDFQKLYDLTDHDFTKFLDACRVLEKHPNPDQGLKDLIVKMTSH